jgi:hypothetical protein
MAFNIISDKYRKSIVSIFFILIFGFGINIYNDYGISFDEPVSRDNGGISLKYVLDLINKNIAKNDVELQKYKIPLNEYRDKDYGVFFDMPIFAIERILGINESRNQYLLRHFFTFIFYFVSIFYIYRIISKTYNWKWGLLGSLLYVSSPRIFAESFYNNKDIVFMSACVFCIYTLLKFIENNSFKNALIHAIVTAISIDIRIAGLMFPLMTVTLVGIKAIYENNWKRKTYLNLFYLTFVFLFVILFWPWLWEDPAKRFLEALKNMSNFRWDNFNLYMGNYIRAKNLPWHYLPVWISITIPFLYIIFTVIGVGRVLILICRKNYRETLLKKHSLEIIALGIFLCPIIISILLNSTIYDGWRQFYFIFPSLILLCISGIYYVYGLFNYKVLKFCLICIFLINVTYLVYWSVKNHPYQNVYFNFIASERWSEKFDADYWGLTNYNGIKNILISDDRPIIKIGAIGYTSIHQSISFLPVQEKVRIIVADEKDADYLITNYRFFDGNPDIKLNKNWVVFEETIVDKNVIFTAFKKVK